MAAQPFKNSLVRDCTSTPHSVAGLVLEQAGYLRNSVAEGHDCAHPQSTYGDPSLRPLVLLVVAQFAGRGYLNGPSRVNILTK
jgi:hypothetical protein